MSFNWKPIEPTLHRLMGFGAMLFNLRLLLERRERNQLPPANDRYPVLFIEEDGDVRCFASPYPPMEHDDFDEYWSKIRVMDTLDDSKQYDEGGTIAWFVLVGASVAAGWFLRGSV